MNKGNAKSLYSKNQILKALLHIMTQKKFEDISIKEITETAWVSRKTFYRNFENKIDVLSLEIDKVVTFYLSSLENAEDLSFDSVAYLIFNTMEAYRPFIKILVKNNLNYLLIDKMFDEIIKVYKVRKKDLFDVYGEKIVSSTLLFSFGGFEKYISYWIMTDNQVTTKQIKNEFKQISQLMSDSIK
ncbi:hypothetical protein TEHN7128_1514 [Tetragenococcus halophilus subsp. halophilus]|uniref:HTH tetR-type domain-containing protein n=2 Tax=Tetragenococcus halophilus TaxID=51669 RepID=A0A2H6CSX9_TETHA|nr:TetR/AcrR family transcriptional regulator [Tetragenococcus halophilus]MCO8285287.1 TetR/AcrR family transcriptional regulator [Tetragenococcus halophilus]MCO8297982.1 TetR/AcrR family transcriptional regulator [Tetragenococcus halophilus]GBD66868.1 hypothetical protein TEHN7116_1832 [Tetragenococcus halophilus subsp. halophilus]GBD68091.1 hypothetical protein TEHN7118_0897 [Tetragenococcus halophilus subsp. halophilus]GBD78285.1 hypothetical protein TEHN7128_1514 [Tetragenococcus halophilu